MVQSLYYCPSLDQFLIFSGIFYPIFNTVEKEQVRGIRGSRTASYLVSKLPGGRWLRVCEENLATIESRVEAALQNVSIADSDISDAILKFYRFRDCLFTEGESEGFSFIFDWSD